MRRKGGQKLKKKKGKKIFKRIKKENIFKVFVYNLVFERNPWDEEKVGLGFGVGV